MVAEHIIRDCIIGLDVLTVFPLTIPIIKNLYKIVDETTNQLQLEQTNNQINSINVVSQVSHKRHLETVKFSNHNELRQKKLSRCQVESINIEPLDQIAPEIKSRSSNTNNAPYYIASDDSDSSDDDGHVENAHKSIDMLFEINHIEIWQSVVAFQSSHISKL